MPHRTLCLAALLITAGIGGSAHAQPNPFGNYGGNFLGTVFDMQSRRPLADVTVMAYGTNLPTKTSKSNADGNYAILQLPYGRYTLTFDKPGYERTVSIGNELSARRNIVEFNTGLLPKGTEAVPEKETLPVTGTDRQ